MGSKSGELASYGPMRSLHSADLRISCCHDHIVYVPADCIVGPDLS